MTAAASPQTRSQAFRFLMVGSINTLATGGIFLALSSVSTPAFAYTIAFVIGIAFAVLVTPRVVFRARASRVGNVLVAAVTFVATASLSFLGARFLFEQRSEP